MEFIENAINWLGDSLGHIEDAAGWVADRADWVMQRVGDFVVSVWNRIAYVDDIYIILGPPLVLLAAVICLWVTLSRVSSGVGRTAKRFQKDMDGGNKGGMSIYYSLVFKLFYYPMVAYFFLTYSPFATVDALRVEETVFYNFRELPDAFKVVLVFLMLRFVGVVVSNLVRLRFMSIVRFFLYTVSCIIIGTYIQGILAALARAGDGNLLFMLIFVIAYFIFSTLPMVYFYIALLLPLYELIMPLLTPFVLIYGLMRAREQEEQDFRDWLFNNHFFAWIYLFVDN